MQTATKRNVWSQAKDHHLEQVQGTNTEKSNSKKKRYLQFQLMDQALKLNSMAAPCILTSRQMAYADLYFHVNCTKTFL